MIVSITCRHGTENAALRSEAGNGLLALSKYDPTITRAQVVFSRETHHKNAENLLTCHLSVCRENKEQVDIYEHQPSEQLAFRRAQERMIQRISRHHSRRYSTRKHIQEFEQSSIGG